MEHQGSGTSAVVPLHVHGYLNVKNEHLYNKCHSSAFRFNGIIDLYNKTLVGRIS